MEFIGSIVAAPNAPGVDKERWVAVIKEHPNLVPPEDYNSSSKEWDPDPDADWAYVKVANIVVGQMKRAIGENLIFVSGDVEPMAPIAREVAALLGGRYDRDALMSRSESGRLIEPIWNSVSLCDGPEEFLQQFASLRPEVGHLFAAHWCQSEVCNGGFHQFFYNWTGVLAPAALAGFRAIGLHDWAEILNESMHFFGTSYPRDQSARRAMLDRVPIGDNGESNPLDQLDNRFYDWLNAEPDRFEKAADEYARSIAG
jgi:hypothetical protein